MKQAKGPRPIRERILASIERHTVVPTRNSIAQGALVNFKLVADAKQSDAGVREAWRAKTFQVVRGMKKPSELFSSAVTLACIQHPELREHRQKFALARIETYNGKPNSAELTKHVIGSAGNNTSAIMADPVLRKAAVAKLIAILGRMSDEQIMAGRHDRNPGEEVKKYLDKRLGRFPQASLLALFVLLLILCQHLHLSVS
ncbi:MAG: hypothetical protein Q8R15_04480 [Candidatus Micrarchaeota archaeon]|nr:hypothetical protein [Candidatus Micrarchaeota archaeon]